MEDYIISILCFKVRAWRMFYSSRSCLLAFPFIFHYRPMSVILKVNNLIFLLSIVTLWSFHFLKVTSPVAKIPALYDNNTEQ